MKLDVRRGQRYEYHDKDSGKDLFSVTQIRRVAFDSYAGIPSDVLEAAQRRGTLVHTFLWKHLAARMDLMPFPPHTAGIEGYCKSVENWAESRRVRAVLIEPRSMNADRGYAGQADAQVLYGKNDILTLMDGKSGDPTVTDPMQLLLYDAMDGLKSKQLLDVYFQKDGGQAKEVLVTPGMKATEWAWAMAALGVLQSRVNHNCQ